jgi:hypothetical protein
VDDRWKAVCNHQALKLEEARYADDETAHGLEDLGVLQLGDLLFGQDVSAGDTDTIALRRRALTPDSIGTYHASNRKFFLDLTGDGV